MTVSNVPNYTVLTPIPTIFTQFLLLVRKLEPNWTTQFDPSLTYETSVRGVRAMRTAQRVSEDSALPLFTYNIAPCIPYNIERRQYPTGEKPAIDPLNPMATVPVKHYKSRMCTFGIPFKIYFPDVVGLNTFQVAYACDASINAIKHFELNYPEIGVFQYNVIWDEISELTYNKENNHYCEASSTAHIYGEFITLLDISTKIILQIHETIRDLTDMELIYSDKLIKKDVPDPNGIL